MPAATPVTLIKNGTLVCVEEPSDAVRRVLEATLFYDRLVREDKRDKFNRVRASYHDQPIDCYRYVHDRDGAYPVRAMFMAGFIPRVATALRHAGFTVRVRDVRPEPRPEIFAPQWDLLKNVKFRWGQRTVIERLLRHQYGSVCHPARSEKGTFRRDEVRIQALRNLWQASQEEQPQSETF